MTDSKAVSAASTPKDRRRIPCHLRTEPFLPKCSNLHGCRPRYSHHLPQSLATPCHLNRKQTTRVQGVTKVTKEETDEQNRAEFWKKIKPKQCLKKCEFQTLHKNTAQWHVLRWKHAVKKNTSIIFTCQCSTHQGVSGRPEIWCLDKKKKNKNRTINVKVLSRHSIGYDVTDSLDDDSGARYTSEVFTERTRTSGPLVSNIWVFIDEHDTYWVWSLCRRWTPPAVHSLSGCLSLPAD